MQAYWNCCADWYRREYAWLPGCWLVHVGQGTHLGGNTSWRKIGRPNGLGTVFMVFMWEMIMWGRRGACEVYPWWIVCMM